MQELILKLNEIVASGVKKTDLEESIGLPKNSLSAVLSGNKEMPSNWVSKINDYLNKPISEVMEVLADDEKKEAIETPIMVVKKSGDLSLAPSPEKLAKLQETLDGINKDFGEGSIMCLGDAPLKGIEAISTGIIGLDKALGIGGLPRGRIVEIYGQESTGKTLISTQVIGEAQKRGGKCAIIDTEQTFDPSFAQKLGVDVSSLFISQPEVAEFALEELDRLISTNVYSVIVLDSVAALVPKGEMEGQMGDTRIGAIARLMSQAMRKIVASVNKTNTLVIFINQIRSIIPQGYTYPGMPTETTTGGNALKFYASVRIETRRSSQIKDGDEVVGNSIRAKIVKSKVSPPFKTAVFDIIYGEGVDKIGEIVDIAVEFGVIKKSGSWYSFNESKLGQGRESVKQLFKDNNELLEEITSLIYTNHMA